MSATPTGYIASHDSTTGLEAITFNGPDVFSEAGEGNQRACTGDFLVEQRGELERRRTNRRQWHMSTRRTTRLATTTWPG